MTGPWEQFQGSSGGGAGGPSASLSGPWNDFQTKGPTAAFQGDTAAQHAGMSHEGAPPGADPRSVLAQMAPGVADPVQGLTQMAFDALPTAATDKMAEINNWIAKRTGLFAEIPPGGIDELVRQREAKIQAERGGAAGKPDPWREIGGVAPSVALGGPAGGLARAALSGAVSATAQPETGPSSRFWSEKGKEAALGGVAGLGGTAATKLLSRLIAPKIAPEAEKLIRAGVPLTPGQTFGGVARRAEDALASRR